MPQRSMDVRWVDLPDEWGASPAQQESSHGYSASPTPVAKPYAPPEPPRATAGIHPDRLRMLQGGGGGFGEHRQQRDTPPHLSGGGGCQRSVVSVAITSFCIVTVVGSMHCSSESLHDSRFRLRLPPPTTNMTVGERATCRKWAQ